MKLAHLLAVLVMSMALAVRAQPASPAPLDAPQTDGEVRKIDRDHGKVTLRHGAIANLDMPGMTMVFSVAEPRMLDGIKEGDKVRFSADRVNGSITVTRLELLR